jgi:hypothetical protein
MRKVNTSYKGDLDRDDNRSPLLIQECTQETMGPKEEKLLSSPKLIIETNNYLPRTDEIGKPEDRVDQLIY